MEEMKPLRDLPLTLDINGVRVSGRIVAVWPNDIIVELLGPVGAGRRTGSHVPHFAMYPQNRYATNEGSQTTGLTDRGRQCADNHLRALYTQARRRGGKLKQSTLFPVACHQCGANVRVLCGSEWYEGPKPEQSVTCPVCKQSSMFALQGELLDVEVA
jgi:hypothetical protein